MKSKPLVSVITPFFNTRPEFMKEAIESVLVQSYSNWELLLIDDGSVEKSSEVARGYAERHHGIRYLEHERHRNRGASASRNLGISHAAGEYIALLDADDVWLPHKLEDQVAIAASHPKAAMLYGNTEYWYSWTGKSGDSERDFIPDLGVQSNTLISPPKLVPLYLRGRAAVPCTCSVLIRRQIVEKIGGFVGAFPTLYDDQAFYSKLCLVGHVFVSSACWDRYRQHSQSTCAVGEQTGQMEAIRLSFLNWLHDYLVEEKIDDASVGKALKKEIGRLENPAWLRWREAIRYIERRSKKLLSRVLKREKYARAI
jgi:glycosyltransferase involved in cell wall biosynthesis